MSTQELFKIMIRDHIAPALRKLGFKGTGQTYCLPDEHCWAMLGIQKSSFSDQEELRFTINLSVTDKDAWDEKRVCDDTLPARPAANTHYGSFQWSERIGRLMPKGEDHWWRLTTTSATADLADEVVAVIHDHGLPAMRQTLADWA